MAGRLENKRREKMMRDVCKCMFGQIQAAWGRGWNLLGDDLKRAVIAERVLYAFAGFDDSTTITPRMVSDRMVAVRRRRAAARVRAMLVHGVLGARHRVLAGEAPARTGERDQARDDEAEQRQEDDRLIHGQPFIRLMSSTAIEPRFRK